VCCGEKGREIRIMKQTCRSGCFFRLLILLLERMSVGWSPGDKWLSTISIAESVCALHILSVDMNPDNSQTVGITNWMLLWQPHTALLATSSSYKCQNISFFSGWCCFGCFVSVLLFCIVSPNVFHEQERPTMCLATSEQIWQNKSVKTKKITCVDDSTNKFWLQISFGSSNVENCNVHVRNGSRHLKTSQFAQMSSCVNSCLSENIWNLALIHSQVPTLVKCLRKLTRSDSECWTANQCDFVQQTTCTGNCVWTSFICLSFLMMHIMCCQRTCLSVVNLSNCKLHVGCLHEEAQVVTCHCDASVAWGCLQPASEHVTVRKTGFEDTWAVHKPCENECFQLTKRLLSETVIWTQDCKCMFCAPTHQNLQHEQSNDDFFHGIQFVFDVQLTAHQWWKHRPSMPCAESHTHFELFANENQKLNVTFEMRLAQNSLVQSSLCCDAQCFCMKNLHAGLHAAHVLVNDCHHNDSSCCKKQNKTSSSHFVTLCLHIRHIPLDLLWHHLWWCVRCSPEQPSSLAVNNRASTNWSHGPEEHQFCERVLDA